MFEEEAKFIHKLLQDDKINNQVVLDIGVGTDSKLKEHMPYYFKEIRELLISHENILLNLDIMIGTGINVVADGHNIPFRDKSIDVVLFFNLVEHVLQPQQVIREIYRVLVPFGICYASAPAKGYPYHRDPIDTLLRLSNQEEWEIFFQTDAWDITLFTRMICYHSWRKQNFGITIIKVEKKE